MFSELRAWCSSGGNKGCASALCGFSEYFVIYTSEGTSEMALTVALLASGLLKGYRNGCDKAFLALIIVEKLGEPIQSCEDFIADLPVNECRYAIYDSDLTCIFVYISNV
ncbi:hypothetical protein J5N97_029951 [Dioscorea zingiberensis]|uniref:Uncharacterized protein n=1 Tax=Dioscorea zingiberensis TaxID=325984 RepID=A0A9D5BWS1_9LILI|nr:hypothetical protein J5N97_029951 [Dioscorea zingiberensis]